MTVPTDALRQGMHADHATLEAIYVEALQAAEAGVDALTLSEIWRRFDHGLRNHLAAEEEFLFPKLEVQHPTEVAELRATHDWIRARLDVLGVDLDLHLLRSHQVQELIERLRAHAEAEDATAYRWTPATPASDEPSWFERLLERITSGRSSGL